ncbi:4-(cytidine 5'-diphospho)-2-C-methyl-D-erythritol kinase [Gallaecimonas sp. GXIMD1310]|uniref:4-(cytidine 5'-diphospho)-2-C-methyl-D-erythritol kinase n=1 Tax=Gallaecimonas sp. GXIMD1310 TaxID=3131926 RepID=UPI0032544418
MATTLSLPAPAKLNRFLFITGQRPDGYHELQTLFQFLDYSDQLHFQRRDDGQIHLHGEMSGVAHDDNLIVRAARLLQTDSASPFGADIRVDKVLPMGGGLGGGSSDAATTLLGLNQLWQTHISLERLAVLGLTLGADVPVFVHGRAAYAEGVGERFQPARPDTPWFLVVKPPVEVNTASVFQHPALTRDTPRRVIDAIQPTEWENDCEAVVFKQYPIIEKVFSWLLEYAPTRMTGTGSCLFARFDRQADAAATLAQLPPPWQGFIAKGMNRSPLHVRLAIPA